MDVEEGDDGGCVEGINLLLPMASVLVSSVLGSAKGGYIRELPVGGLW